MDNPSLSYQELLEENSRLRRKISELERYEKECEKTSESLKNSKNQLRDTAENIPGVIYQFYAQPDGKVGFHYVSEGIRDIFGLDSNPAELFENFSARVAPEYFDSFNKSIEEAIKNVNPWRFEGRFIKESGESIWFQGLSNPVHNEKEILFNGVLLDITERKRIEEALRETETFLYTMIEHSPYSLWIADGKGTMIRMNQACRDLLHVTDDELVGKYNLFTDNVVEEQGAMPLVKRVFERGERVRFTLNYDSSKLQHLQLGNTAKIALEVSVTPVPDDRNRVIYAIVEHADITKRMQVEEELRQLQERFAMAFRSSPAWISITDLQTYRHLEVNDAWEKTFGYTREEAIGSTPVEMGIYNQETWNRIIEEIKLSRSVRNREITSKSKTGRSATLLVSREIVDIGGKQYLLSMGLDITERKRAEEALKLSEMTYREIFNTVNDTIWIHDIETGEFLDVNNIVTETFGYPVDEALKLNIEDISSGVPPFTQKTAMELFKKAADGQPQLFEWHCRHKDGHLFWTEVNLKRGNIAGKECVLAIERDISERKQAEESIRLSEEKFSRIFMTTPDCIAITRMKDGQILDVNPGFEAITGWKRDEAVGRTSYDIGFWADHSERERMVEALQTGGEVLYREFGFRKKDGSLRNGIFSARSIIIGGEFCLVFLLQDITTRRNLEEDRRKLELQLFQSQKLDAVGQLAGGIAHDFNNILMGLQGHISLMLFGMQPEHPNYHRLTQMEEHVMRGATLTRQLLGFAREGKYEVITVDIRDLVQKSVELFGQTRKEFEISILCRNEIYPVEADAGQIDQVLLNIYINASHAMPRGGQLFIEISNMTLQREDVLPYDAQPGHYVKISVTDTGTGMDAETLSKIFEPFFTTKSQQGGTGLGLASAYGIIRNHGGIINAYSELGHGSTFNIYLPASKKTVMPEKETIGSEIMRGEGTILIVDDEKIVLETTSELLRLLGYNIYMAGTGQEALSVYHEKTKEIDLVILDMILPGISGAETMKMIKLLNPDVKVILSSGYSIQGEAQRVMEMGCVGFIQKPFNLTELSQLVHQAVGK